MTYLSVYRSRVREALIVIAGVLLILVALDVMWVHDVAIGDCEEEGTSLCLRDLAGRPEVDEATEQLTSRGRSQQRADYLWGSALLAVGGVLVAIGTVSFVRRAPVVEVRSEGLRLRIGGPVQMVSIPWSDVTWVHSGADGDDEVVPPRVFLVHVVDVAPFPPAPWGATWDGRTLMVDADSWNVEPDEVVAHARMAFETWHRQAEQAAEADQPEEVS